MRRSRIARRLGTRRCDPGSRRVLVSGRLGVLKWRGLKLAGTFLYLLRMDSISILLLLPPLGLAIR